MLIQLINGFINAIVSWLAHPTGLHTSITSPLELAFKGAQYSRLVEGGVTRTSQLTQLPVSSEQQCNEKIQQMQQQICVFGLTCLLQFILRSLFNFCLSLFANDFGLFQSAYP